MSTKALLHHKLEQAIVAWLETNRGGLWPGVRIVAAHTSEVDVPTPFLVVACMKSAVHPDFAGCGRKMPHVAQVMFAIKLCSAGVDHSATIAEWLMDLDDLLTQPAEDGGEDYTKLIADLNPPATGADGRAIKGLYVFAVHPDGDSGELEEADYLETIALEIVAQNGDPTSEAADVWVTEDGDTVVTETGDQVQV